MADDIRTDGWITFAGGMHRSEGSHAVVGDDQAELLVNVTVRHGRADPRPAWRMIPINWDSRLAQTVFERGVIQGSAFYDSPAGPRFVYAADGHLLSFDPRERLMRLVSPQRKRVFHRFAPFVFLQQRNRWLVAQDGLGPPVILDGDAARVNDDPYDGVPTGLMMADGWHRLVVASPCRTRLYLSDHEFDPESTPLSFSDDAGYFKNASHFEIPRSLGKIVGVHFAPSFNNQDDWGPLLVFCERGTRAYLIQTPREQWVERDIAGTILPMTGACSHGAIVARGNDLVFSDHTGRIQTIKAAISRRDDARVQEADKSVWSLYRGEHAGLRRWRRAVRFDDRILTTVWPERVRRGDDKASVRHRGLVVMEEDHLSDRPFVWAGLWTGIYPVTLDVGGVPVDEHQAPVETCVAASLDPDGAQRLYELTREAGPDRVPEPRRVPMWVVPKWLNWDDVFLRKRLSQAALQLTGLRGRVSVRGWWETSGVGPREWFRAEDAGADCLMFTSDGERCRIIEPAIDSRPRWQLPAPAEATEFYRARPWLRFEGDLSLEEGLFEATLSRGVQGTDISCRPPASVPVREKSCEPNPWEPHAREQPATEPITQTLC